MEALACSLPPSHVVWSCGWQEFMAKARAAMFFPTLSMLFFPHGCSPHAGVELGEAEMVFLSISISQREIRNDRCVSGPPSFFNPRNTVCDICSCICSACSSTHTDSSKLQTVVKHRQPFHSQYSMDNYTVFWEKTRLNFVSDRKVLGAGLGLVGLLYCLANLKVQLVKLWWLNVPWWSSKAKSNWSFCWLDCAMEIPTSSEIERERELQWKTWRGRRESCQCFLLKVAKLLLLPLHSAFVPIWLRPMMHGSYPSPTQQIPMMYF